MDDYYPLQRTKVSFIDCSKGGTMQRCPDCGTVHLGMHDQEQCISTLKEEISDLKETMRYWQQQRLAPL